MDSKAYWKLKTAARQLLERAGFYVRPIASTYGINWMNDIDTMTRNTGWKPRTILDAGANVGQTAIELTKHWPDAKIHSFEPVKSTFVMLESATRRYTNITCHHLALADRCGNAEITVQPNSLTNSLVPRQTTASLNLHTETITLQTVDNIVRTGGVDNSIDILKTDTEGFDLEVLLGAGKQLESTIQWVYVETTLLKNSTLQTNFIPLVKYLNSLEFECIGIYDTEFLRPKPFGSFCNVLFRRVPG